MATYWAPSVIDDGKLYHMYLTYVPGVFSDWEHPRDIIHLTSGNLLDWKYESTLKLFRSEGVPTYAIYDRSHRLIHTHSGFPGAGILAADIRRAAGSGR